MQNEITELRNQVRTLKRIVYGFGCLLVAGVVVGATSLQTVPDVIQAKKFQVVTDEGKVIVGLGYGGGGGLLRIFNQYGKQFAVLGLRGEGEGGLGISNKDGVEVAALLAYEDLGMLGIYNKDGEPVAGIDATPGGGELHIFNKDWKRVVAIGADANGDGLMTTHDSKGVVTSRSP